ncbi:lipopolysaccharide biosynthesis protein [Amnibacterium soli]|uniref:lipopolysaccharide biosynthesis protein n=1 Tax=Amnibacterium soli TaxID=1282736 RepID=UPI0031E99ABF
MAGRASRGAAVTVAAQGLRVVVQAASVVVLARLLAPTDYGLIAEVLVIIGLGEIFRDFGLTNAAVQAKTLSTAERSNLFWLNSLIGVVLTGVAVAVAPAVAAFYGDPRLSALTAVLAVTFLLNGLGTQLRADLNRTLEFGRLSFAEIGGQVVGLAVGVAMALLGSGYWSLAGQQVGQAIVSLVLLAALGRFRPQRYRRDVPMRRFVGFGLDVVGAQLLGYAGKNTDTVVIGTLIGAGPLGVYNRAFQLLALPLTQINAPSTRVALPVLSSLQDDPVRYRRYLLAGQSVMMHLVLGVFSWSTALAAPLLLLLGPRWADSVPLFQILAVSGVFTTAGYSTYWVFMSKGLTRSLLLWQLSTRPIVIGAVVLGVLGGVTGVATAYSAVSVGMWLLGLIWIARVSDAPARRMFTNGLVATLGYAFPAAAAWVAAWGTGNAGLGSLLAGTAAWLGALALVLVAWPAFRRDALVVLQVVRTFKRSREERGSGAVLEVVA